MAKVSGKVTGMGTIGAFLKVGTWSETLLRVLNQGFENSKSPEEKATATLAGGIMQHGYQCGMIWGAALAAGSEAFRLYGCGAEAETRAVLASQQLVELFRVQNKHINCVEISDIDKKSSTLKMVKKHSLTIFPVFMSGSKSMWTTVWINSPV